MLELLSWLLSIYFRPTKLHGVCFGDLFYCLSSYRFQHVHKLQRWFLPAKLKSVKLYRL